MNLAFARPRERIAEEGMETAARAAEARFAAAGVSLTLGGEPTFVPMEPVGPEWTVAADGPTKLPIARLMARHLQCDVWPGSTLLYCPGKRYDGEVNPRWALRLITGLDGRPPVRWPENDCQPGLNGLPLRPDQASAWLGRLEQRLGITLHPLPLVDPLDTTRRVWAAPLTCPETETGDAPWQAADWPLEEARRQLIGAPGPAGLRLPLEHFPENVPRQVLTLEIDPDGWELFLPPLMRKPLERLLQAVADSLEGLAAPRLSGMLPVDADGQWQILGLTADPGVLEINLPVCHGWAEYRGWLEVLEQVGAQVELRSWKQAGENRQEGTGGGNHLLWGGPDLQHHPFFTRPSWLVGILRFWQHHPVLAYLFSGSCVGSASQAPRPDEAAGEIFELELAYRALEEAEATAEPGIDHRSVIGETLRHLHADRSGNNHRSEISFDKFWNPGAPAGCLGLVEFRALESLPHVEWSSAIALLWSTLAAHLLEPTHRPMALKDWGDDLHDSMLLPSRLLADLEEVLTLLATDGLELDPAPFRQIWEWRFPPLLTWQQGPYRLELLPALEPWPLICDFPREGGFTSRFIDASLRRFEVVANSAFRRDGTLYLQGRQLPVATADPGLSPEPLAVRWRHQRLYPCLHPTIEPQHPLDLVVRTPAGTHSFQLDDRGTHFLPLKEGSPEEEAVLEAISPEASPWSGRRRPGDATIDLRL